MKYLKVLFIVLIISLISANIIAKEKGQDGPKLIITNSTNEIYIVMLYWIDHPFREQTFGKPFNIVGAELAPGESFDAAHEIPIGKFYIDIWKIRTTGITRKYFSVEPEIHKLIICFRIKCGEEVIDVWKGWLMTD